MQTQNLEEKIGLMKEVEQIFSKGMYVGLLAVALIATGCVTPRSRVCEYHSCSSSQICDVTVSRENDGSVKYAPICVDAPPFRKDECTTGYDCGGGRCVSGDCLPSIGPYR